MKIKRFDVVELNDKNRATILQIDENKFFAEIVNPYGITIDKKYITNYDISKVIYSKNNEMQR